MQPMKKKKNVSFEAEAGLITQLKKTAKRSGRSLSGQIRFVLTNCAPVRTEASK